MTSRPVAFLLAELGITQFRSARTSRTTTRSPKRSSRPSNTGRTSRHRFTSIEHARAHCQEFFRWYNHAHRRSGPGLHRRRRPPRPRRRRPGSTSRHPHCRLPPAPRALRQQATGPARIRDRRSHQPARRKSRHPLEATSRRLTQVRFHSAARRSSFAGTVSRASRHSILPGPRTKKREKRSRDHKSQSGPCR
jgi:hypothetical protein